MDAVAATIPKRRHDKAYALGNFVGIGIDNATKEVQLG